MGEAIDVMFSAGLPLHQTVECIVITEMDVLLDIDRTIVVLNAATRPRNPPMRVELDLVILGVAFVGRYGFQRCKAEQEDEQHPK